MWILRKTDSTSGEVHHLVCGHALVVSRRLGHIVLTNDTSISRKHAAFNLTSHKVETREPAKVELSDLESKYGTFINDNIEKGEKLPSGRPVELHHGDRIRFGICANTWRLEHQDLTVTASTLKGEDRLQLNNALTILGGHLRSKWSSDCCYLVMPAITLTIKVACALAAGRNIVLPEFFTRLADAILKKTPHPDPADFLPPTMEFKISSAGGSFLPDQRRRTIFSGLTFLFATQIQMARMCSPVQIAGGKAELLTEDNHKKVVSGKFLLISVPIESQEANTLYTRTCDLLKEHGLRTVPDSEIGLAIVFVNTKGHCNSAFMPSDIFRRSSSTSQSSEKPKIFATETQQTEFSVSLTGPKVVPDSGGRQPSTSAENEMVPPKVPSKRPLTTSVNGGSDAKRSNKPPSPDLTEPLSTLDLCDENIEDDDIKMEATEQTFKPEHTSTQKNEPVPTTSVDNSATASFSPYTLPSLKTLENEVEEETEPFQADKLQEDLLQAEKTVKVIKKEEPEVIPNCTNDFKFDEWWKGGKEDDDERRKRTRCVETSPQAQENKKIKTDGSNNRSSPSSGCDDNNEGNSSNKRKATDNEGDIFDLPQRARQRVRTVENLKPKETADEDPFALPARSQRSRRFQSHQDDSLIPPTLPSPVQDTPDIAPTPTPESKPNVTTVKEGLISSKFIDREETTTLKDPDNTGELTVSRTLVLVEPMVKVQPIPLQPPSDKSLHSSSLPNFKIFKKVTAASILKVIGGSDFVESDLMAASQEFKLEVLDNEAIINKVPTFDEDLFNMDGLKRKRR